VPIAGVADMNKAKKFPVYKSKVRSSSIPEYRLRAYLDQCAHNDFYGYVSRRDVSAERVVEMLLNDKFTHRRITDPSFPQ
jgi:hypothetical protein